MEGREGGWEKGIRNSLRVIKNFITHRGRAACRVEVTSCRRGAARRGAAPTTSRSRASLRSLRCYRCMKIDVSHLSENRLNDAMWAVKTGRGGSQCSCVTLYAEK